MSMQGDGLGGSRAVEATSGQRAVQRRQQQGCRSRHNCRKQPREDTSRSAKRLTLVSMPASLNESRRFWAWAGAWEPQPITPTCGGGAAGSGRRAAVGGMLHRSQAATSLSQLWLAAAASGA